MAREKKSWCVSENCQSYDIQNMFVVNGARNASFTSQKSDIHTYGKCGPRGRQGILIRSPDNALSLDVIWER